MSALTQAASFEKEDYRRLLQFLWEYAAPKERRRIEKAVEAFIAAKTIEMELKV